MKTFALQTTIFLALGGVFSCTDDSDGDGSPGTETGNGTTSTPTTGSTGVATTEPTTAASSATGTVPGTDSSDTSTSTSDADTGSSEASTTAAGPPVVTFETTMGSIVIQLDDVAAPITTANFLAYVESGFYDGSDGAGATVFHRVIPGFVIQGGGLTETLETKTTMAPIVNEFGNGLTNLRGTISMARTSDPDSATSQFFINLVDNTSLDEPPGYAVFGEVVEGMEVVDAIAGVQTTSMPPYDDVPVEPIIVTSATLD